MQLSSLRKIDWPVLFIVMVWALNLSLIKIALDEIPVLPFNGIRLILASLVLVVVLLASGQGFSFERRDLVKMLLLSISGHTVYQFLFINGFHMTTASNTAVIFGASPVFISLLSSFFKHERITLLGWCGVVLGFVGIYIVISGRTGGFHLSRGTLIGDFLLLGAVMLWAHYSVSSKPLLQRYTPLKFTTITMAIGSVLYFPFSLREVLALDYSAVSLKAWACLVYSGVLALSLALVLWFISVRRMGNSQTAAYSNLQPVLAVIFAHFILREAIAPTLLIGAVIVFAGIYFIRRGKVARVVSRPSL